MNPINIGKIPMFNKDKKLGTSQEIKPNIVRIPRGSELINHESIHRKEHDTFQ